jgi:hypothetical protein
MTVERRPPGDWSQEDYEEGTPLVRASDYDALMAEFMALSQDDGKVERALESAQARIRELEQAIANAVPPSTAMAQQCGNRACDRTDLHVHSNLDGEMPVTICVQAHLSMP